MSDEHAEGRLANRAWWDEAAPLHARSALYDLDGFRAGRNDLRPFELAELGPVAGRDLLHLQCHIGTDTLSWARHGARVVGLDFSGASLEVARDLANDCRIDAEFVCSDVYDAVDALGGRAFDVVYTGIGALGWLPDLTRWAEIAHALVRPGGVLYLVEIHPMARAVIMDGHTLSHDILDAEYRAWDQPGGTYAAPDARLEHTITYEREHALSDVLSAILDAGLALELFHEQSFTDVPWPWGGRGDDGYFRVPDDGPRFPLTYSLRARR
jgi:2-polyprenyl-3-methyl-5-hydroxy-6-metoxy-1,4-benzoquinol methylase